MSGTRTLVHLSSVAMLLLWSAVLLYFYYSGRITQYLPPDGLFQPMVLVAGIGLAVLGLFNLLTANAESAECEGHDHGPGGCGHDHGHDHAHKSGHSHGHSHAAHTECCGHTHDHEHGHHHEHSDGESHAHAHGETCCGHDHHQDHAHTHTHCHEPAHAHTHDGCCDHVHDHADANKHGPYVAHPHGHGVIEESGWTGRIIAILILVAPLTWAAFRTPDRYSANAVVNKGLYNPNYEDTSNSDRFSLRTDPAKPAAPNKAPTPAVASAPASTASSLPAPTMSSGEKIPGAPGASTQAAIADTPSTPSGATTTQSYGSFTLADLEAQVPKSKEGNFILDVPEIYYTAGDAEVQKVIAGQSIETVAQVLPEKVNNEDGHRLRIFRLLVQCCAADARPYSVPVDFGKKAPDFKEMSWVKVTGKMTFRKEGDQTVPVIEATDIEETTAPENSMIY